MSGQVRALRALRSAFNRPIPQPYFSGPFPRQQRQPLNINQLFNLLSRRRRSHSLHLLLNPGPSRSLSSLRPHRPNTNTARTSTSRPIRHRRPQRSGLCLPRQIHIPPQPALLPRPPRLIPHPPKQPQLPQQQNRLPDLLLLLLLLCLCPSPFLPAINTPPGPTVLIPVPVPVPNRNPKTVLLILLLLLLLWPSLTTPHPPQRQPLQARLRQARRRHGHGMPEVAAEAPLARAVAAPVAAVRRWGGGHGRRRPASCWAGRGGGWGCRVGGRVVDGCQGAGGGRAPVGFHAVGGVGWWRQDGGGGG
ncbi:hypothetical protein BT67DRAFT_188219 [Trichocladium antarcticum]|uniref:Uncharacterized protein n=1 Tax=Trichocladium antarcticum TaxID=1450529 RepID=A0AAN6UPX6_9PEZI|nr:hypothetical protein BT67DRAFT_188219 [Trichocladium antarcticum]